ncbi:MAG: hypothetical protein KF791_00370 [Verrucomicrobiae bacterium]|nr:hypothetical protein [Verrucomicrobiae bacterium]
MSEPLDLSLDLEKAFLPAWAQQPATDTSKYAKYEGHDDAGRGRRRDGDRGFDRGPRRDGPGRRPGPGSGPGSFGQRGPRSGPGPGGPRDAGGAPGLRWDPTQGPGRGGRGPRRDDRREAPPEPLVPVDVDLRPDPAGVTSLARQIKLSGRAYPLAEVAGLVVQKPDRYEVTFRVQRSNEGKPIQALYVCSLDDSLWLSEADAHRHALQAHFDTFYQTNKQPCDPPKGVWTLVAVFDDQVLGPPNYHGYQDKLRKLHSQRAPRMPFEAFKSRVRIVKDEAAVKQWLEDQSHRLEFTALNVPEPKTLLSMAEVEAHFLETHAAALVKEVTSWVLRREPNAPRLPEPLLRVLRVTLDRERRFPIRTMTALSGAFAQAGLQFFKRDRTVVHVAVARPHYLDLETTAVQPGIRRIIEFINEHPKCTRKHLVEALVPVAPVTPAVSPIPDEGTAPAAAPADVPVAEGIATVVPETPPSPASPEATTTRDAAASNAEENIPAPVAADPALQTVLGDLHWLIHQGHVIEFANGVLETARKPMPRPEPTPAAPVTRPVRTEKRERPPKRLGRYVWDNQGLLPLPMAQPALVG